MVAIAPVAEPTVERLQLDETSWVDVYRGWLQGADDLYEALRTGVAWQTSRLFRYDHWVEERRLGSMWTYGRPLPHPALAEVHKTIQRRYKVEFRSFSMLQYRDGRDGQAFHRDTDMKWLDETLIPILTLGATRPWYVRPWSAKFKAGIEDTPGKGAVHDLRPGHGDLIVMGGRCQADWQHSVPYLTRSKVDTRISLQWRWTSRRGKPFMGGSYGAPLTYSR
jgi:alkylated DNA repair dioxygenase AlkB